MSIFIVMAITTRSNLNWNRAQLGFPVISFCAGILLAEAIFLYRKYSILPHKCIKKDSKLLKVKRNRLIRALFEFFPLLLVYQNIGFFGRDPIYDRTALEVDRLLMGETPAIVFQHIYTDGLTEIMSFFYLIYFIAPVAFILLYIKKSSELYREMVFSVIFLHFMALLLFIAIPIEGPKYHYSDLFHTDMGGWGLTSLNSTIFENLRSSTIDCFPSMHCGLFMMVTYYMYKYNKKSVFFWLPITLLLMVSTVYLRYHYMVDIIFAVLAVLLALTFSHLFLDWWDSHIMTE